METEPVHSLGNMSRTDLLRGLITERLSTAARDILAAVERTVADYEEEAACFRQEIGRQRRQLELLLQPDIKVETSDEQQAGGGAPPEEEEEDEEQHKYQPRVQDSWSLGALMEASCGPAARGSAREHLTGPEDETASRLLPPSVQSDRRSRGRPQISDPHGLLDLRIRILEDSSAHVLSPSVFQRFPLHELRCPRSLPEDHFLLLLRSTFPQLAAGEPFDVFFTDYSRRLQPLNVTTLTPQEIDRAIRSTGNSALYIRLKRQADVEAADEEVHPSHTNNPAGDDDDTDATAADGGDDDNSPSSPHQTQKHSRLLSSPRVQSRRRKLGNPSIRKTQSHVPLRVRILEDAQINATSPSMFQRFPLHELRCPRGLQEDDFLLLLRSTFPQLAAGEPFDAFTTDKTRRLHPLKVESFTAEQIYDAIRSTGAGNSSLYLRLKPAEERQAAESLQKTEAAAADQRRVRTFPISEPDTHVPLRVRVLEDPQIVATSPSMFQKYPLHELQCPRGLQQDHFLALLRSTFPQLAADQPFTILASQGRRLQPVTVDSLTPEEICRTSRSVGSPVVYIQLKPQMALRASEAVQRKGPPPTPHPTARFWSISSTSGQPRLSESDTCIHLRIRIIEDSQVDVISPRGFKKYPLHDLQCPRGLQQDHFLFLLRSTFPQLAADQPFDVFSMDRSRRLRPLNVNALTPDAIYGAIRSTGAGNSALYLRLKAQDDVHASQQRRVGAAKDSPSLPKETRLHTSCPVQPGGNRASVLTSASTSRHYDSEDRQQSVSLWSLSLSESDEVADGGDHRKPNGSDEQLTKAKPEETATKQNVKTKRPPPAVQSSLRMLTDSGNAALACRVCRVLRRSANMLIKHAWSHVGEQERLCGVCGERWESAEGLKSHLQTHQKTHSCSVCGKSFLTAAGFKGHVARHQGNTPYQCKICLKVFTEKTALQNHEWVHAAEKPHKCDVCQKSFISNVVLKRHRFTHTGGRPYTCSVCGDHFRSLNTLSRHNLLHSARSPARDKERVCDICGENFPTEKKLWVHVRSHSERPHACSKCDKRFLHRWNLGNHMRVHSDDETTKCPVCGVTFSQKRCLKTHLLTHRMEERSPINGSPH